MKVVFVESLVFTKVVPHYFGGDSEYQEFQFVLLENPERGDVMRGCGGLRKIRWRDLRRGKGTRGGLRVIYLYVPDFSRILLLDVYDKNEAGDLTTDERKLLANLADDYRKTLEARKENR